MKDESQHQKVWGGKKRETKTDVNEGQLVLRNNVGVFIFYSAIFPVILHIDYCFGIHKLWLTLTNNILCLGFSIG